MLHFIFKMLEVQNNCDASLIEFGDVVKNKMIECPIGTVVARSIFNAKSSKVMKCDKIMNTLSQIIDKLL